MKRIMRNSMVYLMTAILFAASTGFTLFSHICFMDGERKVSTQKITSCCTHEIKPAKAEISSNCCKDESQFLKFDYQGMQRAGQDHADFTLIAAYTFTSSKILSAPESFLQLIDLPPPKSGRDILSSIQVFRI
ncbi:MAG: hypothetical protein ACHQFW_06100 [Chitinophagales bacterium]